MAVRVRSNRPTGGNCKTCGEALMRYNKHYCNEKCASLGSRKRLTIKCEHCGKDFIRKGAHYNHNARKGLKNLCSKACVWAVKWKGGVSTDKNGYRRINNANKKRRHVFEHRHVWEMAYGPLPKGSTIHHKNGIRSDNRLENLELRLGHHGPHQRLIDLALDMAAKDARFRAELLAGMFASPALTRGAVEVRA